MLVHMWVLELQARAVWVFSVFAVAFSKLREIFVVTGSKLAGYWQLVLRRWYNHFGRYACVFLDLQNRLQTQAFPCMLPLYQIKCPAYQRCLACR